MHNIAAGTKLPVFSLKHKNNTCEQHSLKIIQNAATVWHSKPKQWVLTVFRELTKQAEN